MAKRQISDIVRDKLVKARDKDKAEIVLTDREACDLWSVLASVEAEVSKLESFELKAIKKRLAYIDKYLAASKAKVKQAKAKRR